MFLFISVVALIECAAHRPVRGITRGPGFFCSVGTLNVGAHYNILVRIIKFEQLLGCEKRLVSFLIRYYHAGGPGLIPHEVRIVQRVASMRKLGRPVQHPCSFFYVMADLSSVLKEYSSKFRKVWVICNMKDSLSANPVDSQTSSWLLCHLS